MQIEYPTLQDSPPACFASRLLYRSDRWRRMQAGLYTLAASGYSLLQEVGDLLAYQTPELNARSGAVQRLFRAYLPEAGLAVHAVLPYFRSGLAAVRLSEFGEAVCREYGWPVKESEWGRLLRLHDGENQPEHTAMVLALAREARLRGYRVTVVPDMTEKDTLAEPDLYVLDGKRRRAYIEVETRYRQDKPHKWHNLVALQKFVALAARTPESRRRLVNQVKALGLPGRATDLETLRQNAKSSDPYFLFVERWDEQGNDIPLPREFAT